MFSQRFFAPSRRLASRAFLLRLLPFERHRLHTTTSWSSSTVCALPQLSTARRLRHYSSAQVQSTTASNPPASSPPKSEVAVISHSCFNQESLPEALKQCTSKFPTDTDRTPAVTAIILSSKHYHQQIHGADALHATLHTLLPPSLAGPTTTVLALLDNTNPPEWSFYEQLPPLVTVTALYLPQDAVVCPLFSYDDSIPSFRTPLDEPLQLKKYLGSKGEPLNFMIFTPQSLQSNTPAIAEICLKMQSRIRNLFPNGDGYWISSTTAPLLYTRGRPVTAPIVGVVMTYPDVVKVMSEFVLASFPQSTVYFNTMSANLFKTLFGIQDNLTLPSADLVPTDDDVQGIWRGIYTGYGPEILTISVVNSKEEGKSMFATKLTGDPYVPRGKVSWKSAGKVFTTFKDVLNAEIQVASRNYTNPRFVKCTATMPNPDILHVMVSGDQAWGVVYTKLKACVAKDDVKFPVHGKSFPLFYARECGLIPSAHCTYNIFESRYRRMIQQVLQTDGLIAILDTRATTQFGAYHAVGTLAKVIYLIAEDAPHRTRITVQGIRRFRIRVGMEPSLQEFGLASPVLDVLDDVEIASTSMEMAWKLVDDVAVRLTYNPVNFHLHDYVSANRSSSDCLTMVSFSLAAQLHDEMFLCNPPSINTPGVPTHDETRIGAEQLQFQQRVMQAQNAIERLLILKDYINPPKPAIGADIVDTTNMEIQNNRKAKKNDSEK